MKLKYLLQLLMLGIISLYSNTLIAGKLKDTPGKVTVFTEDGQKFTMYANGIKINSVTAGGGGGGG